MSGKSDKPDATTDRPLSALLSQTLVAFIIELDNEFERRMVENGYTGAGLSLIAWRTAMRFLPEGGVSVEDLTSRASSSPERMKFVLGCLERWGFVLLEADLPGGQRIAARPHRRTPRMVRDGWGSGRGIRGDWTIRLTAKGAKAVEVWRPLPGEIEQRWRLRFGAETITRLRDDLQTVVGPLDEDPSLPALLSRGLRAFKTEFNREAPAPLDLSANILRVLSEKPVREPEIPRLTGASPETSGIGWQVRRYVVVERDPTANRGKVVRLTPLGVEAQRAYTRLVREIEARWETKFGKTEIRRLRKLLEALFGQRDGSRPLITEGLVPPPGVVRSGRLARALGRSDMNSAARKRCREIVAQTQAFISDPVGTLPHYPLWDMNRGFGP